MILARAYLQGYELENATGDMLGGGYAAARPCIPRPTGAKGVPTKEGQQHQMLVKTVHRPGLQPAPRISLEAGPGWRSRGSTT